MSRAAVNNSTRLFTKPAGCTRARVSGRFQLKIGNRRYLDSYDEVKRRNALRRPVSEKLAAVIRKRRDRQRKKEREREREREREKLRATGATSRRRSISDRAAWPRQSFSYDATFRASLISIFRVTLYSGRKIDRGTDTTDTFEFR